MVSTAEKLKFIREARGLSQQMVADRAGMNVSLYKYYEYGWRKPKEDQLVRLAEALCVDVAFLRPSHMGDSPHFDLALLYDFLDCFGDEFSIENSGTKIHLTIDCSNHLGRFEKFIAAANKQKELGNEGFKRWLLTYPPRYENGERLNENPSDNENKES